MSERKTALVTGASRGIGRAIAAHLAEAGLRIAVHYNVNQTAAAKTWAGLAGSSHVVINADLSTPGGVEQLAQEALEVFGGRVDVLVHNAGIYEPSPVLQTPTLGEWRAALRRQMQVNFWAGADLAYLLAPAMAQAGWGKIILVSSRAGIRGEARHAGYAASKAAGINFVKSLAMELGPQGIGCYGVAPGWAETDMAAEALAARGDSIRAAIPLGRVASPDDVAALVAFLASPAADYLTGNTIDVNGASYLH
ncbi:MAG: SDR family oxidoreductase [Armatimonadetes bacterium]|nr:SDR family oxidoreductase [Armatimonadota bacterium]